MGLSAVWFDAVELYGSSDFPVFGASKSIAQKPSSVCHSQRQLLAGMSDVDIRGSWFGRLGTILCLWMGRGIWWDLVRRYPRQHQALELM